MQIYLMPVPGKAPTAFRLEGDKLAVNGVDFDMQALPATGPVRIEANRCIVEYSDNGAVASVQIAVGPNDHQVQFVAAALVADVMADIAQADARDLADALAAILLADADAAEAARQTKITEMLAAYDAGTIL